MADIELVIKIPEEKYLYAKNLVTDGKETNPVVLAIGNGTPLPKGHGRLIDADELDITTITTDDYSGNEVLDVVLKEDIENAPTVNAIPILDGATNGDMIKAMFPNAQIDYHEKSDLVDEYVTVFLKDCDTCQDYSYDWWNAPYNPPKQNLAPADKSGLEYADQPTLRYAT